MAKISRLGDSCTGICVVHGNVTGTITSASSREFYCHGISVAIMGDVVTAICGHTGIINTGSKILYSNGKGVARVGDTFIGDFSGIIESGDDSAYSN